MNLPAPTGIQFWDLVVVGALWAVLVLCLARAGHTMRMGALFVGVALAASVGWALTGLAALVWLMLAALVRRADDGSISALGCSAVAATGMLFLRSPLGFPTASFVVMTVFLAVALAAAHRHPDTVDRLARHAGVRRGLGFLVLATMTVSVAGVLGGLMARARLNEGLDSLRAGVAGVRSGDVEAATLALDHAAAEFRLADDRLGGWWVRPALLVPVLSQHLRIERTLAVQAAAVADSAEAVVPLTDVGALRSSDGGLDLPRVAALVGPLERTEASLRVALDEIEQADSPWLVPPARAKIDAAVEEIHDSLGGVHTAGQTVRLIPALLGEDSPRRYLVLFGTPAEARELGGVIGNVIEISAADGRLGISRHLRDEEINAEGPGRFEDADVYPSRFLVNHPELYTQNWGGMSDFPSVMRAVAELYPTMGGAPIDGALYVDPYGLAAIMRLTGPVEVPGLGRSLDADSIVQFLLIDQYALFDKPERVDVLDWVAVETFDRLLTTDVVDPGAVWPALQAAVHQDRLRMATINEEENLRLDQLDLLDPVPPPDGTDRLAVMHVNGGGDKLDAYVLRSVDYDVTLDPATGGISAQVRVTVTNTVDPTGLPRYVTGLPARDLPPGIDRMQLSITTPHRLDAISVDGQTVDPELQQEFGYERYLTEIDVSPGQSRTVVFDISGQTDLSDGRYHLRLLAQPLVNQDQVKLLVKTPSGSVTESMTLAEDREISIPLGSDGVGR